MSLLTKALLKYCLPKDPGPPDALSAKADDWSRALEAAEKIPLPADRLLETLKVRDGASAELTHSARNVGYHCQEVSAAARSFAFLGSLGTGALLSFALPSLGGVMLIAGLFAAVADYGGLLSSQRLLPHFTQAYAPAAKKYGEIVRQASHDVTEILRQNSATIAASDKFDAIYEQFPDMRDHFVKQFNRSAAKQAALVEAVQEKETQLEDIARAAAAPVDLKENTLRKLQLKAPATA